MGRLVLGVVDGEAHAEQMTHGRKRAASSQRLVVGLFATLLALYVGWVAWAPTESSDAGRHPWTVVPASSEGDQLEADFGMHIEYGGHSTFCWVEWVEFFDRSSGSPTSWLWEFPDGETSTEQNPIVRGYIFGPTTVTLTVMRGNESDQKSREFVPYVC